MSARDMALRARSASRKLQALSTEDRVAMMHRIADALLAHEDEIMAENVKDVEEANGKIAEGLMQRLILKPNKIRHLADGTRAIAAMEEPIRRVLRRTEVAEGLLLEQVTAPIGVLLIIFEARPDALPQIASLALRSGNGLLLKGGKEASRSNVILHKVIVDAIGPLGPDLIGLVKTRDEINDLLALDDVIDLVIPRGGNALVSYIQQHTKIPVLGHADGICNVYIDKDADLDLAIKVALDSKVDYPAACNAAETLLVHSALGPEALQRVLKALTDAGVNVHAGEKVLQDKLLDLPPAPSARHEYGSLDVTLEVVDSMQDAIDHIHKNGSGHTEVIITKNEDTVAEFMRSVDSACIHHNCSSRFSDGFRYGLGAEVGISTSRIHARGPVGVEGLLTSKWLMRGSGHVVQKDSEIKYTHQALPL